MVVILKTPACASMIAVFLILIQAVSTVPVDRTTFSRPPSRQQVLEEITEKWIRCLYNAVSAGPDQNQPELNVKLILGYRHGTSVIMYSQSGEI